MIDTKEYIIDQAYGLFLSKSYDSVSISDISQAIGFTKGALYHHFVNKEDLFKAVIDKYLKILGPGDIPEECTVAEYIRASIDNIRVLIENTCIGDQPFVPVNYLSLLIDALRYYPGFAEEKEELFTSEIGKLKLLLDRAVRKGEIRKEIDTQIMAMNFFTIITGIAANLFRSNSPEKALLSFQAQLNEFYKILKK